MGCCSQKIDSEKEVNLQKSPQNLVEFKQHFYIEEIQTLDDEKYIQKYNSPRFQKKINLQIDVAQNDQLQANQQNNTKTKNLPKNQMEQIRVISVDQNYLRKSKQNQSVCKQLNFNENINRESQENITLIQRLGRIEQALAKLQEIKPYFTNDQTFTFENGIMTRQEEEMSSTFQMESISEKEINSKLQAKKGKEDKQLMHHFKVTIPLDENKKISKK